MKTRLITSILFLLFIVSCGSSDTDSIDTINTQKLDKTISTMAIGDNLYSFEYDDNNRVTTCKAKEVWQENWDAYFTYSNDKVVFKLNQQTISYSINNGRNGVRHLCAWDGAHLPSARH
ncbi:MAG: hypothetical protein IJK50_07400 [Prevotella sp.]|nr:hypothetical protein [Prevotella sp.]